MAKLDNFKRNLLNSLQADEEVTLLLLASSLAFADPDNALIGKPRTEPVKTQPAYAHAYTVPIITRPTTCLEMKIVGDCVAGAHD